MDESYEGLPEEDVALAEDAVVAEDAAVAEEAVAEEVAAEEVTVAEEAAAERAECPVTVTEHTPENLRGYVVLLAFALVMAISCAISAASAQDVAQRSLMGLGVVIGLVLGALSAYMLVVWKNRQLVVDQDGVTLTDFLGHTTAYPWDNVRIQDQRTTTSGDVVFLLGTRKDHREESFSPTCGGFRKMVTLLVEQGRLRPIDEDALARKRRAKSLFDVVRGGRKAEKPDESLYLPAPAQQGEGGPKQAENSPKEDGDDR